MAIQTSVNWIKCQGDRWCDLFNVNLAHSHFAGLHGVYVIWHGGQSASTVYVGQGVIAERIRQHREDPKITSYSHLGLFVTWAQVDAHRRDGVEAYLAERLLPRVGARHPAVPVLPVNLPW